MSDRMRYAWIFDFVTMVAVIAGVIYGAIELRNLRDSRERDAMLRLFEISQSESYAQANAFMRSLPGEVTADQLREAISRPENASAFRYLSSTWEGLGILSYRRQLPLAWVDEYYGGPIFESWRKFKPFIEESRRVTGRESLYEWFQWLAETLHRYEQSGEHLPAYRAHATWQW